MITVRGVDFYTAEDAVEYLDMKYSSVIYLLRTNNIPKYGKKYIITKEQLEKLKQRQKQTLKLSMLNVDNTFFKHKEKFID